MSDYCECDRCPCCGKLVKDHDDEVNQLAEPRVIPMPYPVYPYMPTYPSTTWISTQPPRDSVTVTHFGSSTKL